MSNELTKPGSSFRPKVGLVGLAAKKAAMEKQGETASNAAPKLINPNDALHRIGIIFDDSGSMAGSALENAKKGVEEFLRSCVPNQTSVTIYPMNASPLELSSNLPALAMLTQSINATGGTYPMEKLSAMLGSCNLTRCIIFSDGAPSSSDSAGSINYQTAIDAAKTKEIPVDTVYIGPSYSGYQEQFSPETYMQTIAKKTGGIYLHFDPSRSNFATAFKYLSPGFRGMLADKSFVDKIQNGGV